MYRQRYIDRPIVSFYLTNNNADRHDEIVFGGIDRKHYIGQLVYVPVDNGNYWQFHMEHILLGTEYMLCAYGCEAVADTGTSLIGGPKADIDYMHSYLGGHRLANGDVMFDCDGVSEFPTISFVFGNKQFTLEANHYVTKVYLYVCPCDIVFYSFFSLLAHADTTGRRIILCFGF